MTSSTSLTVHRLLQLLQLTTSSATKILELLTRPVLTAGVVIFSGKCLDGVAPAAAHVHLTEVSQCTQASVIRADIRAALLSS